MTDVKFNAALIVGAGSGLSASLARALAKDGIKVALAARSTADLDPLVKETGARSRPEHGARAFAAGHPRGSRRDRRRHQERAPRGVRGQSREPARPRRHRRELHAPHPSAAQRLGVGDRAAAVGGEILTASDRKERTMTDKVTIPALLQMKRDGRKSVGVVAWDYQIARIADRAGVDIVSVGDSVGVNLWGHSNPLEVTMDEMLVVCKAVRRGVTRALVSCDFPYGPLQEGCESAVRAAIRLVKEGGADMVKLGGAADFPETVRALTRAGLPVFAQLGITPHTALRHGLPYGAQSAPGAQAPPEMTAKLVEEAKLLEDAGASLLDFTNSGPVARAASAAWPMMTSCSILPPPAATAPTTSPATVIGKPPGTLVKSPIRTAMLSAFSSGA